MFNFQAKEKRAFKDLCQITPLQAIFVLCYWLEDELDENILLQVTIDHRIV